MIDAALMGWCSLAFFEVRATSVVAMCEMKDAVRFRPFPTIVGELSHCFDPNSVSCQWHVGER